MLRETNRKEKRGGEKKRVGWGGGKVMSVKFKVKHKLSVVSCVTHTHTEHAGFFSVSSCARTDYLSHQEGIKAQALSLHHPCSYFIFISSPFFFFLFFFYFTFKKDECISTNERPCKVLSVILVRSWLALDYTTSCIIIIAEDYWHENTRHQEAKKIKMMAKVVKLESKQSTEDWQIM